MADTRLISYRHEFSEEELEAISLRLADTVQEVGELEEEKKAVASDYKARIDGKKSTLSLLSRQRRDGYETRTRLCELRRNMVSEQREWVDPATGDVLQVEPLTAEDRQLEMEMAD